MAYQRSPRTAGGLLPPPSSSRPPMYAREDPYARDPLPVRQAVPARPAPPPARDPYRDDPYMSPPASAVHRETERPPLRDPYREPAYPSEGRPRPAVATRDPYAADIRAPDRRPPPRQPSPESRYPAAAPRPKSALKPATSERDNWQKEFEDMEANYFLTTGSLPPPRARSPEASRRPLLPPPAREAGNERYDPFEVENERKTILGSAPQFAAKRPVKSSSSSNDDYNIWKAESSRTIPSGPPKDAGYERPRARQDNVYSESARRKSPPPAYRKPEERYPSETSSRSTAAYGEPERRSSRFDDNSGISSSRSYDTSRPAHYLDTSSQDRSRQHDEKRRDDYNKSRYQDEQTQPKKSILVKKRAAEEDTRQPKKIALPQVGEIDVDEIAEFKRWKEHQQKVKAAGSPHHEAGIWSNERAPRRREPEPAPKPIEDYSQGCKLCQISSFRSVIERSGHAISLDHCMKLLAEQAHLGLNQFKVEYPNCYFGRIVEKIIEKNPSEENMFIYRCGNVLENHCKMCNARTNTANSWFQHVTGVKHAEKFLKYIETHDEREFHKDFPCLPKPSQTKMQLAKSRMEESMDVVKSFSSASPSLEGGQKIKSIFQLAANMGQAKPRQPTEFAPVIASAPYQKSLLPHPNQYANNGRAEQPKNEDATVHKLLGEIEKTKEKFQEELEKLNTQQQKLLSATQSAATRRRSPSPRGGPRSRRDRSRSPLPRRQEPIRGHNGQQGMNRNQPQGMNNRNQGMNRNQLQQEGMNRNQLQQEGMNRSQMQQEGMNRNQLQQGGMNRNQLQQEGMNRNQLQQGGMSRNQLQQEGMNRNQLQQEGMSRNQLQQGGMSRNQLQEEGMNRNQLQQGGMSRNQLQQGGMNRNQQQQAGGMNRNVQGMMAGQQSPQQARHPGSLLGSPPASQGQQQQQQSLQQPPMSSPQRKSRFDVLPARVSGAPLLAQPAVVQPQVAPGAQQRGMIQQHQQHQQHQQPLICAAHHQQPQQQQRPLLQNPQQQQLQQQPMLALQQQQQRLMMMQQQQQQQINPDTMGAGDVSVQQAMEIFNSTIQQFIALLSKNQGAANTMLDPATLSQLQAVMRELDTSNQQQDQLQSQGQALSALSNMDPNVMQQLMASDPQLQGLNIQEMLSGLVKMQQNLIQQRKPAMQPNPQLHMHQDEFMEDEHRRRQHMEHVREAHARNMDQNRLREQQVREIQLRELEARRHMEQRGGPRPHPPSLLTMRTTGFRPR